MHEYREGFLVRSNAGHDKGNLYIIKFVEDEYVFLVDGKIRKVCKPKKKKKKHIEYVTDMYLVENDYATDEKIKRIIKQAKKQSRLD